VTLITAHVRVLNSLLFVGDSSKKELPTIDGNGSVWSTASCVAVSCLPDCDGPTEIIIGALSEVQSRGEKLVFDGEVETPSRAIVVETVLAKKILQRNVLNTRTHIRIWTNGLRDTDKVIVGLT
jgi:hypothetical protein